MPAPRFYHPGTIASSVKLETPAVHHALNVLRLKSAEAVVVFNGNGGEYRGVVSHCGKNSVTVDIREFSEVERESPLRIALAQGISSSDNMDFTVQKATELGVASIQPLATQKSVVRLSEERAAKRAQHWQRVVISACEQCGRNRVPRVEPALPLREWLAQLGADEGESRWLLSPDGNKLLRDFVQPSQILLLAGPEGGFTPAEEQAAEPAGFVKVKLGPRTLRTETAALAALAAIQALWGDF
ncbi:MAG: 16S rRNA (uracil(1498)-N(3))-methyltransferase [Burkholderiales bacterium]